MIRTTLIALLLLASYGVQAKCMGCNSDKWVYGLDAGFAMSSSSWSLVVGPQVGYRLNRMFTVGGGVGYIHQQSRNDGSYKYKTQSASVDVFARLHPWRMLVFQLKPEAIYTWDKENYGGHRYSKSGFAPAVTVGAGVYLRPIMLMVNYDLVQNNFSPYSRDVYLSVGLVF